MSASKMITLNSCDGESFEIEEAVALKSQTLKNMIEDGCADNAIPLPIVSSEIMAKVIEYCKRHVEFEALEKKKPNSNVSVEKSELGSFDSDFVKVDQGTLFDLILAANYLHIKGLLDLTCQTVADMMKGKSTDEIRATFNIVNDFTEEEEEKIRQENAWAFE